MYDKILNVYDKIDIYIIMDKTNTNNNMEYKDEITELMKRYIESMNDKERVAYEIAKDHLQSSFDLVKSIGYKKFAEKNK
tara:strand:- start:158 stop:397 length:240 start_codon:yes stop_codon:yes gene_type:complete